MTVPRTLRLDEVAEVTAGNPAPQEQTDFCIDGAPFVRMQDVGRTHWTKSLTATTDRLTQEAVARHRLRRFPRGTLLIPKSGASVNLNHRALLGTDAYVVSHLATVIPDATQLDAEYLYYWSLTYDPRHQAQTTSLPSLPTALIKAARLPVPSMPEQRRIVDLLSRAEGIVHLRREAQQKAAELIPAIFIDMFGNPAKNSKGWPVSTLGEVLVAADYGSSTKASQTDSGLPIIRMGNVTTAGDLDLDDLKYVELSSADADRFRLRKGDLLFNRTNSKDLVGKTGLWDGRLDAVLASYFIRLRARSESAHPTYLWAWMNSRHMKRVLFDTARGAIGQANINSKELKAFPVAIPPLKLQHEFDARVQEIASIQSQQRAAVGKAVSAFEALLAHTISNLQQ